MSVLVQRRRRSPAGPQLSRDWMLDGAAVALPTALALGLMLYDLSTRSLWLDEAATVTIAAQHGSAFGTALAHDGGNMLGYYALLHVLTGTFGHGPVVIRLPSALAGAGVVALTGILALRLFDRAAAVVAGVLGAVSLSLIYWSQVARGYTLMIALICASFLLLAVAAQRGDPGWRLWLGYVVVSVAAVYMGLEAALVFPAQLLVLLRERRLLRWLVSGLVVIGLACVPLAVLALDRGSSQLFWIPAPNAYIRSQVLLTVFSAGLEPQFYSGSGDVLRWLTEVVLGLGACFVLWQLWRGRGQIKDLGPALVLGWLVLPGLISWVVSELGHPMFEARYLLICLPAVALFLSWILCGLWRAGAKPGLTGRLRQRVVATRLSLPPRLIRALPTMSRVLALGLLAAFLTLRALQVAPAYGVSTEPWRAVTARVLAAARPGDCVAFYPLDTRMPFRYYVPVGETPPRAVLPAIPWNRDPALVERYATLPPPQVATLPARCGRVWLIASHQGKNAPTPGGRRHYRNYLALRAALGGTYRFSRVSIFGRARLITVDLFGGPRSGAAAEAR